MRTSSCLWLALSLSLALQGIAVRSIAAQGTPASTFPASQLTTQPSSTLPDPIVATPTQGKDGGTGAPLLPTSVASNSPSAADPIVSNPTGTPAADQQEGIAAAPYQQPHYSKAERDAARIARHPIFDDQYHLGLLATAGIDGLGLQLGYPISHHINVRAGASFFKYTQNRTRDDTTYGGTLYLGGGRLSVDYFPWRERRFHISPVLVVANQTHATVQFNIQPDAYFDLENGTYFGPDYDPLRGTGRLDFRRTSPGLMLGFGNLTHGHGHWLFPVDFGFYYNSTPTFQINFTGTACTPYITPPAGCAPVANNAGFQRDLQLLRNEVQDNLHYARFVPILNYGIGYRF